MMAIYTVGITIALILIFLICFLVVVYQKYSKAYAETKYLKGQLNAKRNGDETVFEFGDENSEACGITPKTEGGDGFNKHRSSSNTSDEDSGEEVDISLFEGQLSDDKDIEMAGYSPKGTKEGKRD